MLTKELTSKTTSFAKGANYVGETWYGKKHGEGGARHGALNKRGARSGPRAAMSPRPPRPPRELPLLAGSRLKNASIKDRNRVFNEQELFSFIHISKAGGSTFIRWAQASRIFPHFYPASSAGPEHGYFYDRAHRPMAQRPVFLRSPRAHVLSMFFCSPCSRSADTMSGVSLCGRKTRARCHTRARTSTTLSNGSTGTCIRLTSRGWDAISRGTTRREP